MSYCRVSAGAALLGWLTATAITSTPANAPVLWGRHEQGSIKDAPPPSLTERARALDQVFAQKVSAMKKDTATPDAEG